jgi:hypothetical protein
LTVVCVFVASLALYMLFAGSFETHEALAGLGGAVVVTVLAVTARHGDRRAIRLRAPWVRLLLRVLRSLLRDTVRVGAVLLRAIVHPPQRVTGRIARQIFVPGDEAPSDRGRRALVTLAASVAPNGIVLELPRSPMVGEHPVMLLHRLVPDEPAPDPEWPA